MKKFALTALVGALALSGCSNATPSADPAPTVTVTAASTPSASASIEVAGEESGAVHLVEYRAYSHGGNGKTADASVRWTTKKLPQFEDISGEWSQTMAFENGEWASVLVTAREDVSVGCELYFDGELIDSQGMDTEEYKVECKSYVE